MSEVNERTGRGDGSKDEQSTSCSCCENKWTWIKLIGKSEESVMEMTADHETKQKNDGPKVAHGVRVAEKSAQSAAARHVAWDAQSATAPTDNKHRLKPRNHSSSPSI